MHGCMHGYMHGCVHGCVHVRTSPPHLELHHLVLLKQQKLDPKVRPRAPLQERLHRRPLPSRVQPTAHRPHLQRHPRQGALVRHQPPGVVAAGRGGHGDAIQGAQQGAPECRGEAVARAGSLEVHHVRQLCRLHYHGALASGVGDAGGVVSPPLTLQRGPVL
eukprot:6526345-Pyramimonas_sp.AAC.1